MGGTASNPHGRRASLAMRQEPNERPSGGGSSMVGTKTNLYIRSGAAIVASSNKKVILRGLLSRTLSYHFKSEIKENVIISGYL